MWHAYLLFALAPAHTMVIQPALARRALGSLGRRSLDILRRCLLARSGGLTALLLHHCRLRLVLRLLDSLILVWLVVRLSRLLKVCLVRRRSVLMLLILWLRSYLLRRLLRHLLWHLLLGRGR